MIRVEMKTPCDLMKSLLLIKSQHPNEKVVIDVTRDTFWYATDALAYGDVFRIFTEDPTYSLDIEVNLKAYCSQFFLVAIAPLPKEKVFIGEGVFMTWQSFNEYVFGNEMEQVDVVTYYEKVEAILNEVLTSRYEMDLDEVRHYVDKKIIWREDDIVSTVGCKELSESEADKILQSQPKIKPEAIITFDNGFNPRSATEVIAQLDTFRQAGFKEAVLILNSPGGNVYSYFAIKAAVKRFGSRLKIYSIGMAASAGGFLLSTGPNGGRVVTKSTIIMIHQFRGFGFRETLDFNRELGEEILDEMTAASKLTREEVRAMLDRDTYMTPEEALEYGFIDAII